MATNSNRISESFKQHFPELTSAQENVKRGINKIKNSITSAIESIKEHSLSKKLGGFFHKNVTTLLDAPVEEHKEVVQETAASINLDQAAELDSFSKSFYEHVTQLKEKENDQQVRKDSGVATLDKEEKTHDLQIEVQAPMDIDPELYAKVEARYTDENERKELGVQINEVFKKKETTAPLRITTETLYPGITKELERNLYAEKLESADIAAFLLTLEGFTTKDVQDPRFPEIKQQLEKKNIDAELQEKIKEIRSLIEQDNASYDHIISRCVDLQLEFIQSGFYEPKRKSMRERFKDSSVTKEEIYAHIKKNPPIDIDLV